MFIDINLKRINIDVPYVDEDGTKHLNLRDPALRESLGITEIEDPERKNEKFYYVQEEDFAPYISNTPKDTLAVQKQLIQEIKHTASSLLVKSDWKIIRASEGVAEVDDATLLYRQAVRAASNTMEAEVNACSTIEDLEALDLSQWPSEE